MRVRAVGCVCVRVCVRVCVCVRVQAKCGPPVRCEGQKAVFYSERTAAAAAAASTPQ